MKKEIVDGIICKIIFTIYMVILTICILFLVHAAITGVSETEEVSDFYYYQAEVVSQSNGTVVFGGVDVENPQLFAWKSTSESINIDVPYLLTMDSKGTETTDDDEILVVWACVN